MGFLSRLGEWWHHTSRYSILTNDRDRTAVTSRKIERWRDHEVARPDERCDGHSRAWTMAPGIWYCRDCHEWFRTWEKYPTRPYRQQEGY